MNKSTVYGALCGLILLIAICVMTQIKPFNGAMNHIEYDTIPHYETIYDTIPHYVDIPNLVDSLVIDTILDTTLTIIPVYIPITSFQYSSSFKSNNLQFDYVIFGHGYRSNIDSVVFNNIINESTRNYNSIIREKPRPKRWSLNTSIGYGVSFIDKQAYLAPTISIGIGYNIYSW